MNFKINKTIVRRVIFWLVSFVILFRLFTKDYNNGLSDILYTLAFHIPLIIVVCINEYIIPSLITKRKYFLYGFIFFILLDLGIFLHYICFNYLTEWIFPGYYYIAMPFIEIIQYIFVYLVASSLIYLADSWFDLRNKQIQLERENIEVQLSSLKAQVNPHFLFNSLNNIYALSNQSNQKSNDYIIKLSDALRYVLYNTSADFVKLNDEIDYLRNYIDLERLRLEDSAIVSFNIESNNDKLLISPLILLPLVENCFKHCDKENPVIQIEINIDNNNLQLVTSNNYKELKGVSGGVGLSNLKKRLDLIYKEKYNWLKNKTEDMYTSELKIQLHESH